MTASADFLTWLVIGATILSSIAPVVLVVLFVRDARSGRLW